jgi:membrane-associated phospholipid phosphatase
LVLGSVWGRVYFGCHWLLDAVLGALHGWANVMVLHAFLPLGASWGLVRLGVSLIAYEVLETARKRLFKN